MPGATFVFLQAVDPSLGRFDRNALTDQMLMELLIEPFDGPSKQRFLDSAGHIADACVWLGVFCSDAGDVESVFISEKVAPSINLQFLPSKLLCFSIRGHALDGSLDVHDLPATLMDYDIADNKICGELDLPALPRAMRLLCVEFNLLTGTLDLKSLPPSLETFYGASNQFTGSISLTSLPEGLEELSLSNNMLSGEICLDSLPLMLQEIRLDRNHLTGEFSFRFPPSTSFYITARQNRFVGTAVVYRGGENNARILPNAGLTSIVDENRKEFQLWHDEGEIIEFK